MPIYENIPTMQLLKKPFRILSNAGYAFLSKEKTGKPFKVKFECSTLCNLKCTMCPLTKGLTRKRGVLSFENFKKVYDEIKVPYLNLTGLGEPLMNPEIFKIIKYARKRGAMVKLDTNGTLLTSENIKKLIEADPTFISMSIDAMTKERYEKIRKGANFDKVIENLKKLIGYRNKMKSKTQIHLFYVFQKDNAEDLIKFIKFADSLGVDAINGAVAMSFGKVENEEKRNIELDKIREIKKELAEIKKKVKTKINLESVEAFLNSPEDYSKIMLSKPCFYPWYNPCITWDGYVVPCDVHCNNEIVLGNAFIEPFMKIWNNKKARQFRKQLLKKRVGVCEKCFVDESYILDKLIFLYKMPLINLLSDRKIR
ncbi:MAG: radical SAM protein [Candidatus Pacearchaeota archaeon]